MNQRIGIQIREIFDADGSGDVSYREFADFCETKDIEEAVGTIKENLKKSKKREKAQNQIKAAAKKAAKGPAEGAI